jgi:transcription termination/antitermination protein NusG
MFCDTLSNKQLQGGAQCSWYAVFTQCHHERRVARQLEQLNVEHFLPTYQRLSQWKDRITRLEQPLFPAYLFVRIVRDQAKQVLQTRGTVKLVGYAGRPMAIPDAEISCLQFAVRNYPTEPAEYLNIGEHVRIDAGPLRGVTGILVRKNGKARVSIAVDTILRSFTVEIDASLLTKIGPVPSETSRRAFVRSA